MVAQGTTLAGRYRLDTRIGAGGMGEVWRGEDVVLARTVAVKVLLPGRTDAPGFVARFQGEARAMATINHPGVVDVYDYGVDQVPGSGATAYLVMKFVDGEPLDRLLNRLVRIPPEAAMELIAQAASALQAVHDEGIVHRDIKPGNLMVRPDGTLVLTDFGIARAETANRLTDAGMVLGTAAYCAPEQAEGAPVTPAVDIYALGVVAYECLAGQRPFDGDTPVTIALKHIREQPPPLPLDVPPAVRAVVERALSKDPAHRFPNGAAMSTAAKQAVYSLAEGSDQARPAPGRSGRHAAPGRAGDGTGRGGGQFGVSAAFAAGQFAGPEGGPHSAAGRGPARGADIGSEQGPGSGPRGTGPADSGPLNSRPMGSGPIGSGPIGAGTAGADRRWGPGGPGPDDRVSGTAETGHLGHPTEGVPGVGHGPATELVGPPTGYGRTSRDATPTRSSAPPPGGPRGRRRSAPAPRRVGLVAAIMVGAAALGAGGVSIALAGFDEPELKQSVVATPDGGTGAVPVDPEPTPTRTPTVAPSRPTASVPAPTRTRTPLPQRRPTASPTPTPATTVIEPPPSPTATPTTSAPKKQVPGVVGLTADMAKALLVKAGFAVRVEVSGGGDAPSCSKVVDQFPAKGTALEPGKTVRVVIYPEDSCPSATPSATPTSTAEAAS
jgi:hypothetical protein